MYFDVVAKVSSQLLANSAFTTALGNTDNFVAKFPVDNETFPLVTINEINQTTLIWVGDQPNAVESELEFDVWTQNVSYNTIVLALTACMVGNLWGLDFSQDIPDPQEGLFHRNLRFRRTVTASDLI